MFYAANNAGLNEAKAGVNEKKFCLKISGSNSGGHRAEGAGAGVLPHDDDHYTRPKMSLNQVLVHTPPTTAIEARVTIFGEFFPRLANFKVIGIFLGFI